MSQRTDDLTIVFSTWPPTSAPAADVMDRLRADVMKASTDDVMALGAKSPTVKNWSAFRKDATKACAAITDQAVKAAYLSLLLAKSDTSKPSDSGGDGSKAKAEEQNHGARSGQENDKGNGGGNTDQNRSVEIVDRAALEARIRAEVEAQVKADLTRSTEVETLKRRIAELEGTRLPDLNKIRAEVRADLAKEDELARLRSRVAELEKGPKQTQAEIDAAMAAKIRADRDPVVAGLAARLAAVEARPPVAPAAHPEEHPAPQTFWQVPRNIILVIVALIGLFAGLFIWSGVSSNATLVEGLKAHEAAEIERTKEVAAYQACLVAHEEDKDREAGQATCEVLKPVTASEPPAAGLSADKGGMNVVFAPSVMVLSSGLTYLVFVIGLCALFLGLIWWKFRWLVEKGKEFVAWVKGKFAPTPPTTPTPPAPGPTAPAGHHP